MKTLSIVVAILTLLLAGSVLICGFWMKAQPKVDPSSIAFHMKIGVAAFVGIVATCILLLMANRTA